MDDVKEEPRFVCKMCSKICVSGKSLGGHMRVHLADIAASRKAAKEEDEKEIGFEGCDDREDGNSQLEENQVIQFSNCNSNPDFLDVDPNSSYELRENPKKSCGIPTESKHGDSDKETVCKFCSKEFPSLRALAGHMRSHSVKKNVGILCKECGRGFNSVKAMYGHMKSHSGKSRAIDDSTSKGLSGLENLCPIRRKRSRIRYHKSSASPTFHVLSASGFTVSEKEEEAAECLMLLSKAERKFGVFESVSFSDDDDDDDSVYFGGESYMKIEKITGDLDGTLDYMTSCVTNSACTDKMEVDFPVSDEEESCKESSEIDAVDDMETLNGYQKKLLFRLGKCTKILRSHSNIGGHVAAHKTSITSSSSAADVYADTSSVTEAHSKLDHHNHKDEQENSLVGITSFKLRKRKRYQCLVCFKGFPSGQALGGHKRAHFSATTESKLKEAMPVKQEINEFDKLWDLNFAVAATGGS